MRKVVAVKMYALSFPRLPETVLFSEQLSDKSVFDQLKTGLGYFF